MPFILSSKPAPSDSRTQSSRETQFGRQRFQNKQTSKPSFLTRQRTHVGTMFTSVAARSNEGPGQAQFPAGAWNRTVVVVSFMTLWVICLAVCAIYTDFAFSVEPPPSLPFEFRVYTSRMDFASKHLPTTFKWRRYHIEAYLGRRPLAHPASEPQASTSGIRSAAPSESPVLEYASISAGGRVIQALTSDTYSPASLRNLFPIFSRGSRENSKHSPAVALTDGIEPGECWALRGDFGQIGIQFTHAIRLSSLVVGHTNVPSLASAPKKLVLWGLKSTDNGLCDRSGDEGIPTPDFGPGYCGVHLLTAIHKPLLSNIYQNFTISMNGNHYFDRIIVQVLANWGHKAFTCIYRIQVYGNPQ